MSLYCEVGEQLAWLSMQRIIRQLRPKTEGAAPRLPRSPSFPHISIYLSDVKAAFMAGRSGWRAPQTGAARVAYETDSGHTDPVHVCMSMLLHVLALARRHTSLTRYQREQSPKPKVVFPMTQKELTGDDYYDHHYSMTPLHEVILGICFPCHLGLEEAVSQQSHVVAKPIRGILGHVLQIPARFRV